MDEWMAASLLILLGVLVISGGKHYASAVSSMDSREYQDLIIINEIIS